LVLPASILIAYTEVVLVQFN